MVPRVCLLERLRVWVAQLTTDGEVSISLQAQILNQGLTRAELVSLFLVSGPNDDPVDNICGCTDPSAFNYNPEASMTMVHALQLKRAALTSRRATLTMRQTRTEHVLYWMPLARAAGLVRPMQTPMASATTSTHVLES